MEEEMSRREFINSTEKVGELLLAGIVGFLGMRTYPLLRNTYFVIEPRHELAPDYKQEVQRLIDLVSPVVKSAENLYDVYRGEYLETKIRFVPDGDGGLRQEMYQEWEDPELFEEHGIDHRVIGEWHNHFRDFQRTNEFIMSEEPPFYIMSGNNMSIEKKVYNHTAETILSIASYGLPLIGFVGYEELLDQMDVEIGWKPYDENYKVDRRTFLKLGAITLAGIALYPLQRRHLRTRDEGIEKTEQKIREVLSSIDIPDEQVFREFYDIAPTQLINEGETKYSERSWYIADKISRGEIFEQKGFNRKKPIPEDITEAFTDFASKHNEFSQELNKMFSQGIPENLAVYMKSRKATNMIQGYTSIKEAGHYFQPVGEGLLMTGIFAAIMTGYELYSEENR